MKQITTDDMLDILRAAHPRVDAEGVTAAEIAAALGCSIHTAQRRVQAEFRAGRARRVGSRLVEGIDGVRRPHPVYRIEAAKR